MRPLTDLETAEVHLLNARLDARRRFARGEFTREELDLIERETARALGWPLDLAAVRRRARRDGAA